MVLLMTSVKRQVLLVAFCDILFLQVWSLAIYFFLLVMKGAILMAVRTMSLYPKFTNNQ